MPLPDEDPEFPPVFFLLGEDGRTVVRPKSPSEWKRWTNEHSITPQVAATHFGDYFVSTVFLSIAGHGPDQLFETMIFKCGPGVMPTQISDSAVWRCATWDEAERQHDRACTWLRQQFESGALPQPIIAPHPPLM